MNKSTTPAAETNNGTPEFNEDYLENVREAIEAEFKEAKLTGLTLRLSTGLKRALGEPVFKSWYAFRTKAEPDCIKLVPRKLWHEYLSGLTAQEAKRLSVRANKRAGRACKVTLPPEMAAGAAISKNSKIHTLGKGLCLRVYANENFKRMIDSDSGPHD